MKDARFKSGNNKPEVRASGEEEKVTTVLKTLAEDGEVQADKQNF